MDDYLVSSENQLPELAGKLLSKYPQARIFAFYGELGAGKTTFIKTLCNHLKVGDNVASPSFALIYEYRTSEGIPVYHFDFYRIKNLEEVYDLGYEDYFFSGGYCFIEWPELVENLLPENTIRVKIKVVLPSGERIFTF